jgi:hypothetical protein
LRENVTGPLFEATMVLPPSLKAPPSLVGRLLTLPAV